VNAGFKMTAAFRQIPSADEFFDNPKGRVFTDHTGRDFIGQFDFAEMPAANMFKLDLVRKRHDCLDLVGTDDLVGPVANVNFAGQFGSYEVLKGLF
jgi:hypothetical protein